MEKMQPQNNIDNSKDEVGLMQLLTIFWLHRKIIFKTTFLFVCIGLLIAFTSLNKYKSEAKLLPELPNKEGGVSNLMKQFGGLSSLAGIDLNAINSSDALNPMIYPDIVKSTPIMVYLLNTLIYIPIADKEITLFTYLNSVQKKSIWEILGNITFGLPSIIKKVLMKGETDDIKYNINGDLIRINMEMYETIKKLEKCIDASVDLKSGIISISAEFREPEVAAQIAQKAVILLTQYITDYRIQKVRDNLVFISEQCEISKIEFNKAQKDLANFIDKNKNIISALTEIEKNRLQSEYDLKFSIYNSLCQQKEQAKIKVQDETPVFKVLNPVQVPNEKSKPHRSLILLSMFILGVIIGIAIIIIKFPPFTTIDSDLTNESII